MADNPIFSYTRRDYEGSRQEGLARIPIISKGKWTDLNSTDPGIIILDYVHALVDMMNYYQDHQALETFVDTVKERANIFRLAKQFSYSIRSAKGAMCNITFSSSMVYSHAVKIPKYTIIRTRSGIEYLTDEDAYLPAGKSFVVVPSSQGKISKMTYKGTGISRFSTVEGAANQSVKITAKNVDIDTIVVTDNIGRVWTAVDYIIFSTEKDRVYQVDLNPDDTITIKFGDGDRGVVPGITDEFTIRYKVTEAEAGRVGANELLILKNPVLDSNGNYVDFNVCNIQSSTGGSSSQSSEEIRELIPGVIKSQDRAVTLSDFENLAKLVPGVSEAKAYDINTHPDLCLYHEVKVLILPTESYMNAIDMVKENVYNYLSQRMIPPTNLQIFSPVYTTINIAVSVRRANTEVEGGLEYTIYQTIVNYFNERSGEIGVDFYPTDLAAKISAIPNVRYISSITPSSTVELSEFAIAKLGEVTVSVQ